MSLRQFNDSLSTFARLRKVAVGSALRMFGGRFRGLEQLTPPVSPPTDLVGSHLAALFGEADVDVAISIGRELRPNLKPVLQVMGRNGRVLGYAKLGWNDVTRALVDNEARVLRAWAASAPRTFRVPSIIHDGVWEGLRLLVVSPVPHPILRRVQPDGMPGPDVLHEIASLGGTSRMTLRESDYVRRLLGRLDVLDVTPGPIREAADSLRREDPVATMGTWHGDWAPWNMTTTSRALHVWDWERSADHVPIGLDALHHGFEVDYHRGSRSAETALSVGLERCRGMMDSLGLNEDLEARRTLYVLERFARTLEGQVAGVRIDHRLHDGLVRAIGA